MNSKSPGRWRGLLILPPIIVGIVVLMWMAQGRQPPLKVEPGETTRTVRVIEAPLLDLIPRAEGYGPVQPAKVWTAVSQVSGRVVEIHPKLRDGEILAEGAELLRIDPVDYELALAQTKAELAELEVQEQNARASLAIEQRNLELARQDLERNANWCSRAPPPRARRTRRNAPCSPSRSAVQNLNNTLSLIPTQRSLLEAKADRLERDLEHTSIRRPLQYAGGQPAGGGGPVRPMGQSLFEGDAVERVEIEAQVAMSCPAPAVPGGRTIKLDITRLNEQSAGDVGLDPLVRLDLGNHVAEWQAEFVRFERRVDPRPAPWAWWWRWTGPSTRSSPATGRPCPRACSCRWCCAARARPRGGGAALGGARRACLVADADNRLRRRPVDVLVLPGRRSA